MSIIGEKSLRTEVTKLKSLKRLKATAYNNIGICCETLCDRTAVKEYFTALENKVEEQQQEIKSLREAML